MPTSIPRASGALAATARLLGERAGVSAPSSWLIECADLLPSAPPTENAAGAARPRGLDVACGTGRHALLLAASGFEMLAIDRDAAAIEGLLAAADRLGPALRSGALRAEVRDLEALDGDATGGGPIATTGGPLAPATYDLIVVVHYLHRPLFPALVRALAPGGLLLYETFTVDQVAIGHPRNPAFLLNPGELLRLVAPLEVLRQREGEFDGRWVASVAARSRLRAGAWMG